MHVVSNQTKPLPRLSLYELEGVRNTLNEIAHLAENATPTRKVHRVPIAERGDYIYIDATILRNLVRKHNLTMHKFLRTAVLLGAIPEKKRTTAHNGPENTIRYIFRKDYLIKIKGGDA